VAFPFRTAVLSQRGTCPEEECGRVTDPFPTRRRIAMSPEPNDTPKAEAPEKTAPAPLAESDQPAGELSEDALARAAGGIGEQYGRGGFGATSTRNGGEVISSD